MSLTDIAYDICVRKDNYYPNNEWESLIRQLSPDHHTGEEHLYKDIPEVAEKLKTSQGTKIVLKAIDGKVKYLPFRLPESTRMFERENEEDEALRQIVGPFEIVCVVHGSVCIFAPELQANLVFLDDKRKWSEINIKGWRAGLNVEFEKLVDDLYHRIPEQERYIYAYCPKDSSDTSHNTAFALCKKFRMTSLSTAWVQDPWYVNEGFIGILRLGDFYFLNADCERKPYGYLLGLLSALSVPESAEV